jgi:glycosyltransferase involved in cell wall biosynthesis
VNVSIIIPAYNAARTISDALESILGQSFPNWEAIVIDDGSTDATPQIAKDFADRDSRVRLITQPNTGEAGARNTGIAQALYDWLLFLDADDWISPVYLERMTNVLISDCQLDAVHCRYARVASDGTEVVDSYRPPSGDLFPTLARRAAFPVHACVVRRSLVEQVGRFDHSLQTSPDWDLWQRVARTGARFGAVEDVLAFYRMNPNGASLDACQLFKDGMRVLKQGHSPEPRVHNPHPDHEKGEPPEQIRTQEFYLLSWCAGLMLGSGKDPRPLVELVGEDHYPELYPDAVAQCLFESTPLPTCQPPSAWEKLWPTIQRDVEDFFVALEKQSRASDLAHRALCSLKGMILKSSPMWGLISDELQEVRRQLADQQRQTEEQKRLTEDLRQSKALLEEERSNWQRLAEKREQTVEEQRICIAGLEQARAALEQTKARLEEERNELQEQLRRRTAERDEQMRSDERRLGDLLLNRLHLRGPLQAAHRLWVAYRNHLAIGRLAAESRRLARLSERHRIMATVCDTFPIYSQTFVYQELTQLARDGFDLRLVYSKLDTRDYLPAQFGQLWKDKRCFLLDHKVHKKDFVRYQSRMPEKVDKLIQSLCEASGLARQDLLHHGNFLQAFSFTRMVEAYRPAYLHSYFFYDRSLMALVAGYLLDIPRGISCYADHLLKDYELKVVPLHLKLCDIIIATSKRIKQELLAIAPQTDHNRILVKPNGIDTECFRRLERAEPADGAPFRLVSVCRIEPKKGLLDLVEAVKLLRQRGLPVEAHLVGTVDEWSQASRDYKRKLDQRISELGLWGTVHLEGRQNLDGVLRFLRIAHLFVAPFVETESGDKDGIPTAVLEGMSTGLPAVATDVGSMTEVIDDGQDGVLVSQRDPAGLGNAIEALLSDPGRRQRLGKAAADKVRRRFDVRIGETTFHERVRAVLPARRICVNERSTCNRDSPNKSFCN